MKDTESTDNKKESNHHPESCVDFTYLKELTVGHSDGMKVMLTAYLEETPKLLNDLKQGIETKDWTAVKNAAHSMLPSFPMLGMNHAYEEMARNIQDYAAKNEHTALIKELFLELEKVCGKAIIELQKELADLDHK